MNLISAFAPLGLFVLSLAIVYGLRLWKWPIPAAAMSVGLLVFLIGAALFYTATPNLFEDAETQIACVSALMLRGLPVYTAPVSAAQYSLVYGPVTYLTHALFYSLFGVNLFSFKLVGFIAFLVTLFGLYRVLRQVTGVRSSLVGLGLAAVLFLRYLRVEFWGRNDPIVLCSVTLALWALTSGSTRLILTILPFTFSVIPNLKISGVAYLLPLVGLLYMLKGPRISAGVILLSALLFPLPFLVPTISFSNYLYVVQTVQKHPLSMELLLRNLQYGVLLLLPIATLVSQSKRPQLSKPQTIFFTSTLVGIFATCIFGSKAGAGSYHLMPYSGLILYLGFWIYTGQTAWESSAAFRFVTIVWVVTMLLFAIPHIQITLSEFRTAGFSHDIVSEIRGLEASYRGRTLEIAVPDYFVDRLTRFAYVTVFDGQPYTISGASLRDLQYGGARISDATLDYLEHCGTQIWLVPKSKPPFTARNDYFDSFHPAFSHRFQSIFTSRYQIVDSTRFFDVWSCKG